MPIHDADTGEFDSWASDEILADMYRMDHPRPDECACFYRLPDELLDEADDWPDDWADRMVRVPRALCPLHGEETG